MKLFYDNEGNVIGSYEAATDELEAVASMPNANEIQVPQDLVARITDNQDSLHPHDLVVVNDQIIESKDQS